MASRSQAAVAASVDENPPVRRARRLQHNERKQLILEEAAQHFADQGFDLSTPELAKRLGIAQSLLYRYYATKQDLILGVYGYLSPSSESYDRWIVDLQDRSISLRDRLRQFYLDYTAELWGYQRVRIIMWANLLQPELNKPYYDVLQERIFPVIAEELRATANFGPAQAEVTQREIEMVRSLHGAIYHMAAIRRWILAPPRLEGDLTPLIELKVDMFLRGAREVLIWG
jgi:AcrR family transcriptional regulator